MSYSNARPDPAARWLSHVLVGLVAGAFASKKGGLGGFIVTALVASMAHEVLDAPFAGVLSELGV
jgi:hypothetical protein